MLHCLEAETDLPFLKFICRPSFQTGIHCNGHLGTGPTIGRHIYGFEANLVVGTIECPILCGN